MAIALAKNYVNLLDEVYKSASVTAGLTSSSAFILAIKQLTGAVIGAIGSGIFGAVLALIIK